jgi:hypothetical protein
MLQWSIFRRGRVGEQSESERIPPGAPRSSKIKTTSFFIFILKKNYLIDIVLLKFYLGELFWKI